MADEKDQQVSCRRDFIRSSIGLALAAPCAAMLSGCASLLTRNVTPVNGTLRLPLTQYPELTQRGGSLRLMPAGSADPIYVFVRDSGQFLALSSICTHLSCTVELQGARLICPCHGSAFDREGVVLQGPAVSPLARFRSELVDGGLLIIHLAGEQHA
jgi:cytochrome b6-f complex iron-sulfur subunit